MQDAVKKIRELLDELESKSTTEEPSFKESFQLFELPEIVADIVDYLQPALLPHPTQKPVALLERIIQASSNPGNVVLDLSAAAARRLTCRETRPRLDRH